MYVYKPHLYVQKVLRFADHNYKIHTYVNDNCLKKNNIHFARVMFKTKIWHSNMSPPSQTLENRGCQLLLGSIAKHGEVKEMVPLFEVVSHHFVQVLRNTQLKYRHEEEWNYLDSVI